ncbi:MAG: hypothetical protein H6502_03440 [Candidatus Woesearchaeota archaeon]|nr:MAG: hypothetical protein H6502_03440 [Candidatus Woesearchaeota archaeon]
MTLQAQTGTKKASLQVPVASREEIAAARKEDLTRKAFNDTFEGTYTASSSNNYQHGWAQDAADAALLGMSIPTIDSDTNLLSGDGMPVFRAVGIADRAVTYATSRDIERIYEKSRENGVDLFPFTPESAAKLLASTYRSVSMAFSGPRKEAPTHDELRSFEKAMAGLSLLETEATQFRNVYEMIGDRPAILRKQVEEELRHRPMLKMRYNLFDQ